MLCKNNPWKASCDATPPRLQILRHVCVGVCPARGAGAPNNFRTDRVGWAPSPDPSTRTSLGIRRAPNGLLVHFRGGGQRRSLRTLRVIRLLLELRSPPPPRPPGRELTFRRQQLGSQGLTPRDERLTLAPARCEGEAETQCVAKGWLCPRVGPSGAAVRTSEKPAHRSTLVLSTRARNMSARAPAANRGPVLSKLAQQERASARQDGSIATRSADSPAFGEP